METNYRTEICQALDDCWQFLEGGDLSGFDLYRHLDDGTDSQALFIAMQLDETEENRLAWDNVTYAIAAIAREAYLIDGPVPVPEPLEVIDADIVPLFVNNLKTINDDLYQRVDRIKTYLGKFPAPKKSEVLAYLDSF